jgi:hypothetical protein
VTHHPCSFQRTKAHVAPKLARADAFAITCRFVKFSSARLAIHETQRSIS